MDRGGARTLNLLVRSQVLYIPVELRDQMNCPCQESNLDRKVRSLACYPLQITRAVWRRSVSIALSQHMRPGSGPSRCANRRYPRRGSNSLPPLIRGRAATGCQGEQADARNRTAISSSGNWCAIRCTTSAMSCVQLAAAKYVRERIELSTAPY